MITPASGLLVAAPRSGSGKTTLVLGLLRGLARNGVAVQPMKCGPDYIDPGFHTAAAGRTSYNLDSWAMRPSLLDSLIADAGNGADLILCEALMGLFDGVAQPGDLACVTTCIGFTATITYCTARPAISRSCRNLSN